MKKHMKFLPAAVLSVMIAAIISYTLYILEPGLTAAAEARGLPVWNLESVTDGLNSSWFGTILYTLSDLTEGNFVADALGSAIMILGGLIAAILQRRQSPLGGTGTMDKTWMWLVAGQLTSTFLAAVIWRNVWPHQWMATFTPSVAVMPLAIHCFGKPNYKKFLTGSILGALLVPPLAQLWLTHITNPMGWPHFSGCFGIVMPICSVIGYEIMNRMPWMHTENAEDDGAESAAVPAGKQTAFQLAMQRIWGGDSSELYYWGSNVSWIFLMTGWLFSYLINPANVNFSVEQFFLTILTSAIGIVIWGPAFEKEGYIFTCAGILVTCALWKFSGGNWPVMTVIAIVSQIVGPAWCRWAGKQKFFQRYAPCIYLQFGTAVLGMAIFYICKLTRLFP